MFNKAFYRKYKKTGLNHQFEHFIEIARPSLAQEQRSTLLSYFIVNDKAKAGAKQTFAVCKNDDEKLAYLKQDL
ncbi:1865_t:CDS:2 [Funneliformis mosseae]|uniref:1865_t:CDS:1 n=1 Tax=Funneliformis mosseae TaxID=27381 RepID=A0A9N8ZYC5_FUNMO|nr:1865_t:CDS:2 [Funneliformis mosseae]